DRAVLQLATRFGFDPDWRRLRCSGHVINLVVKAILYGKGVSKAERQLQCCNDQESFSIWRQRGVIGKVHNIVRYITRSDQRRQHFETLQAEALQDDELFSLQLIKDGGIRWNSTFSMLERALKLRNAIELFCAQWERDADYDLSQDFLKRSDWEEIQRFVALLKPFKDATLELEGHAIHGNYGALWQALEMMDILHNPSFATTPLSPGKIKKVPPKLINFTYTKFDHQIPHRSLLCILVFVFDNDMKMPSSRLRWKYTEDDVAEAILDVTDNGFSPPQAAHKRLAFWILRQESLGYAPSHSQIRACVMGLLRQQGEHLDLGRNWVNKFIDRRADLKTKMGRRQEAKRFDSFTPRAVHWYFDIRDGQYGWINPENTVNVDEGGIMTGFGKH
ncbi:hypothetical protein BFJ63_vAg17151, partial [Fusarium oxysporum f. sp. narcissi]